MLETASKAMWHTLTSVAFGHKSIRVGLSQMWPELLEIVGDAPAASSLFSPCE